MDRLTLFREMLGEKRVGFLMDEVMTGTHEFVPGMGPAGKKFMEFAVSWGTKHVERFVNPRDSDFLTSELEGTVTIEGLCTRAPCSGTLELRYFDEHKIRYTFDFSVGGKAYHYVGEKRNIKPWNLPVSHTTCYGQLIEKETGRLVSTSITYFRLRKAPGFLMSLRFA
jgi:hypothetical protein